MVRVNGEAAYDSSFSSNRVRRRMRSMALCRAVWMIQARGDSGTPDTRHWSTAAAKASWAASSATSKSLASRIRVATIRPQSERYTASIAASVSPVWATRDNLLPVSIRAPAVRPVHGGIREVHAADLPGRVLEHAEPDRATADL